jgi:hypothetical protein
MGREYNGDFLNNSILGCRIESKLIFLRLGIFSHSVLGVKMLAKLVRSAVVLVGAHEIKLRIA